MTAEGFVPLCDGETARQFMQRRRWFRRPPALLKLEQIWLPCQMVHLSKAVLLVHGYGRCVTVLSDEVSDREVVGEAVSYPLTASQSLELARETLVQWRLNRMVRAASPEDLQLGEIVHLPYWVGYESGRGDAIRYRMVDGLTGRPAVQAIRLGFLEALQATTKDRLVS